MMTERAAQGHYFYEGLGAQALSYTAISRKDAGKNVHATIPKRDYKPAGRTDLSRSS